MTSEICPRTLRVGNRYILYDAGAVNAPTPDFFDPEVARAEGRVTGKAKGRGETWFVEAEGRQLALRHYRRGGLVAKLLGDQYLGWSVERSRAFREWRLLAELYRRGLPVPRPIAACVQQHACYYRADIATELIEGVRSLAQSLEQGTLSEATWLDVGRCVSSLHREGCFHADLNAHNILLDDNGKVHIIDFDRCSFRRPGNWQKSNVQRLRRSLLKLKGLSQEFHFLETEWGFFLAGYGCQ